MRIAVFGGSFNPIHIGHTSLAASLIEQKLADEVWLLVSPLNPLKQAAANEIADYEHRLHMAQIATEKMPKVVASDFESHLPIPSYMINTLDALTQQYPEHKFMLVIGADNWDNFTRWYMWQDIIAHYPLLIYRRPGYPIDDETLSAYPNIKLVTTPLYDISSTQLRLAIQRHSSEQNNWMHPAVIEYINKNKLYM